MEPLATSLPPPAPAPAGRPLSAGDVIGRSFTAWFRNLVPFSVVTLVINIPVFVLAAATPLDGSRGWSLLVNVVSGLADLVVAGALTYGVLETLRGNRVPLGTLLGTGFAKFWRVLVVSLGVGVRVFLATLLLVVPGIVLFCRLYVAVPAAVVEPIDASDGIDRSRTLTEGSRWAIFAVALVAFVVTIAISAAGGFAVALGASALPARVATVLETVIAALASPLGACTAAVAYHDLRVAKEGVDTASLVKVFE